MGEKMSENEIEEMISFADPNKTNNIDYIAFTKLLIL